MEHITPIIYNSVHDAKFLLDEPVITFDFETDTDPLPDNKWWRSYGTDVGTSYVTDATHLSFYSGSKNPVVVFTLPRMEDSLRWNGKEDDDALFAQMEKIDFIKELFSRNDLRIVGHNVIFDCRLLGHFGIEQLPHEMEVWDTQSTGLRMLFNPAVGDTSLEGLTDKWGLNKKATFFPQDRGFYSYMKIARRGFSATASLLPLSDFETWINYVDTYDTGLLRAFVHGEILAVADSLPETDEDGNVIEWTLQDVIDQRPNVTWDTVIENLISHYVGLDTVYTHRLYELQQAWVNGVTKRDHVLYPETGAPLRSIRWTHAPQILANELRLNRINADQCILGVKVDLEFAEKRMEELQIVSTDLCVEPLRKLVQSELDLLPALETLKWYSKIFELVTMTLHGNKVTFRKPTKDWNPNYVNKDFFRTLLSDESVADFVEWLVTLDDTTNRKTVLDYVNEQGFTKSQLQYIYDTAVQKDDEEYCPLYVNYLNEFSSRDLGEDLEDITTYARSKYYLKFIDYLMANWGKDDIIDLPRRDHFKRFLVWVVSEVDIVSDDEIKDEPRLVVKSIVESYAEDHGKDSDYPLSVYAVENDKFSVNKDSLQYYIKKHLEKEDNHYDVDKIEDMHPLALIRLIHQSKALSDQFAENIRHAQRDGRVHPVLKRATVSGRYSSSSPNLQNLKMRWSSGFNVIGMLHGDEGKCFIECDYSNAENVMGAMVSKDDDFATATETGDFHSFMAETYWPEAWKEARENEDGKALKDLRNTGKAITFGNAYGAGPAKLAAMTKLEVSEVKEIMQARLEAYPKIAEATEMQQKVLLDRFYEQEISPLFVVLWNGARVQLWNFTDLEEFEDKQAMSRYELSNGISLYRIWNYIQQGSVSELLCLAMIDIDNWLHENGFKSRIAFNVHDSIIFDCAVDEYETVMPRVFELMGEQVPEKFRQRTTPPVHFVSEAGPENATKWGFRHGYEYPFSLDHFANRWGIHLLPEDELAKEPKDREAPTWRGPIHEGWSIEQEIAELRAERNEELLKGSISAPATRQELGAFLPLKENDWIFSEYETLFAEISQTLEELQHPRQIELEDGTVIGGVLDTPNFIKAANKLYTQGQRDILFAQYQEQLSRLTMLTKYLNNLAKEL